MQRDTKQTQGGRQSEESCSCYFLQIIQILFSNIIVVFQKLKRILNITIKSHLLLFIDYIQISSLFLRIYPDNSLFVASVTCDGRIQRSKRYTKDKTEPTLQAMQEQKQNRLFFMKLTYYPPPCHQPQSAFLSRGQNIS